MLRALAVTGALTMLAAAAPLPPQHQPAAEHAGTEHAKIDHAKAEAAIREKRATEKREAEMKRNQLASETRDKAWDGRMKRTMSGVCRGC